jgi:hypothetical protein
LTLVLPSWTCHGQARISSFSKLPRTKSAKTISSHTGLTLTINPGEGLSRQPITLLTTDAHHLRSVLEECKRLKEVFGTLPLSSHFSTILFTNFSS